METVKLPKWKGSPELPSAFQIDQFVNLVISKAASELDEDNVLHNGRVIKIHFAPGKVCYDLEFTVAIDNANKKRYTTRIHNVDGALCEPAESSQNDSALALLSEHFSPFICKQLKQSFGITKVEEAKNLRDSELMRTQGVGKMFIQKLRKL